MADRRRRHPAQGGDLARRRAGTALVFPGRTEFAEKYGRVAGEPRPARAGGGGDRLARAGLSDRHPRNAMLGHVRDFADYQLDVAALLELADALDLPSPRFLVAHSMGGCIALRALVEHGELAGGVFSAPMWGLHLRALTRGIAGTLSAVAGRVGLGDRPMPGTRRPPALPFAGNVLTSDPEAFRWCQGQLVRHPELALGGPSLAWTGSALREARQVAAGAMPGTPALVLLGSAEVVVAPEDVRRVARRLPRGELVELAGGRHEIFMERAELTAEVWRRVDGFLGRLSEPAARSAAVAG
ncbi:MAG: alpha/beta hydrolase [Amaricoccus sp.]